MVGPILAFAGLWGVPYIKTRFGLSATQSAAVCSAIMIAWAGSSPVLGRLSDRLGRRKPLYLVGTILAACGWATMIFVPGLSLTVFTALALATGISSGGIVLSFAYAKESVPPHLAGTVSGTINTGIMIGPTLLQPIIGMVLDMNWTGKIVEGARVYDLIAYQTAFSIMIVWTALSCVLIGLTRETYCRQMV